MIGDGRRGGAKLSSQALDEIRLHAVRGNRDGDAAHRGSIGDDGRPDLRHAFEPWIVHHGVPVFAGALHGQFDLRGIDSGNPVIWCIGR